MMRPLLFAAAMLATPALAADWPDPRCSGLGDGFVYAEGIGSCVKVGGLVRMDAGFGRGRRGGGPSSLFGGETQADIEIHKDTELGPFQAVVIPRGVLQNELR